MKIKAYRTKKTDTIIFDFREVAADLHGSEIDTSCSAVFGVESFKNQNNIQHSYFRDVMFDGDIVVFNDRLVDPTETYDEVVLAELLTYHSRLVRLTAERCLSGKALEVFQFLFREQLKQNGWGYTGIRIGENQFENFRN